MKDNITILQNFIIGGKARLNHFLSNKGITCTAKVLDGVEWIVNYKRDDEYYPIVKQRYDELWNDVSDADRERAPVKFVPDMNVYR